MTILIDLSQLAISNIMKSPNVKKGEVDAMLIKHMVLNSLRAYKQRFNLEYGSEVVIACDSKHYWRKDVFPHYKAHRKKQRQDSNLDWNLIFSTIDSLKNDLRENFPYKVLEVHGAEGDDIIAVVASVVDTPVLIIGSDKDYCQLHYRPNVAQYAPTQKKFVTVDNPTEFLNELIITGDKDDGVPNIRSDSDTFVVEKKRQGTITKANLAIWRKLKPEEFCESRKMLENYQRNKELIDFSHIPVYIKEAVLAEYAKAPQGDRQKIMNYFIANRMRNLLGDIHHF